MKSLSSVTLWSRLKVCFSVTITFDTMLFLQNRATTDQKGQQALLSEAAIAVEK
ncbi:hypothetical protein [Endozoicomonas sp. 4G]|uniref:hypothetical protein n=1 Tax=Endozoicomonas sp. 4G TaxID=2872754 RepID=UPI00207868E4|nr:hypothetical protein [Endozoicomonas sp. 4G]